MQLATVAFGLICATSLMASPITEQSTTKFMTEVDYVELFRHKTPKGSLIYLGPPDVMNETETWRSGATNGTKTTDLEPNNVEAHASCPTEPAPTCDKNSNTARNGNCDALVTELGGDPWVVVGTSPRQVCYEGDSATNQYCCVSWEKAVPGLNKGDLAGPANNIMAICTANGISGKMTNTQLHNSCTAVCLSNRGTGC